MPKRYRKQSVGVVSSRNMVAAGRAGRAGRRGRRPLRYIYTAGARTGARPTSVKDRILVGAL